nr:hypothetical protein [Chloroflexota bacterium]
MKQDAEVTAAPPAVLAEDPWMSQATRELARGLLSLRDEEEALRYLRDLCTVAEMED